MEDYRDAMTGIWYQTDKGYTESGTNHRISSDVSFDNPYYEPLLRTLRSFPEGDRNCYTLKPQQGKNNNYLIRAIFFYQNYDYKYHPPTFDLYLGANYWDTVRLEGSYNIICKEIIHVSSADAIRVCLVSTGGGTPIISSLELRPLNNSIYTSSLPLDLVRRHDIGTSPPREFSRVRYKDDIYDRLWRQEGFVGWYPFNTTGFKTIELQDSAYKLPPEVLETAMRSFNRFYAIKFNGTYDGTFGYYVYLHFAEIERLGRGRKRIINVDFDGTDSPSETITLEYLKPITLISKKMTRGYACFTITATAESDAPPILNAFEVYKLIPQPNSPTDAADADAILEIKLIYGLSNINWQGDPCAPIPPTYAWDGLKCSSGKNPRIVSLNLSSSRLTGEITSFFSNLKKLEFLDLSSNELTGPLPEFLAEMPNLKFLNLTGNRLEGSIPKALKEKPNLQLSLDDSPGLCQKDSCKKHSFVIPLIVSMAVLAVIAIASLLIWRLNRKRLVFSSKFQKKGLLEPKDREFSYADVVSITDNFKIAIGEGGFGQVYLGTLQDGTKVAVKLLSPSSKQGYTEFQSEAQLLMIVHHRNLVSLVGYCNEDDVKALIYEYMDNGDLNRQLSVKKPSVLKWNERVQIAVDAAQGLHYLHNGCKLPIIHRDLKPSNILLNNSMEAKILDFGLSRAFANERESHLSTQPAGTPGYIDPEFQRSGILNKKSDIYSFVMILLELITGLPPIRRAPRDHNIIFILDSIHPKIESGDIQSIVDPRLQADFSTTSAWKIIEIAMSCISPSASQRPDISNILFQIKELMLSPANGLNENSEICPFSVLKLRIQLKAIFSSESSHYK